MLLESERLRIRNWLESDADAFYLLNSDAEVMRYFPFVLGRRESDELLRKMKLRMAADGYGFWPVEEKTSREFIGFIGINSPRQGLAIEPCVEIGWRLNRRFWGKGYATEGARTVLKHAFETLGIKRIYSFTATINKSSEKVMKKLGMSRGENFYHPSIDREHPLCEHLLYHIDNPG